MASFSDVWGTNSYKEKKKDEDEDEITSSSFQDVWGVSSYKAPTPSQEAGKELKADQKTQEEETPVAETLVSMQVEKEKVSMVEKLSNLWNSDWVKKVRGVKDTADLSDEEKKVATEKNTILTESVTEKDIQEASILGYEVQKKRIAEDRAFYSSILTKIEDVKNTLKDYKSRRLSNGNIVYYKDDPETGTEIPALEIQELYTMAGSMGTIGTYEFSKDDVQRIPIDNLLSEIEDESKLRLNKLDVYERNVNEISGEQEVDTGIFTLLADQIKTKQWIPTLSDIKTSQEKGVLAETITKLEKGTDYSELTMDERMSFNQYISESLESGIDRGGVQEAVSSLVPSAKMMAERGLFAFLTGGLSEIPFVGDALQAVTVNIGRTNQDYQSLVNPQYDIYTSEEGVGFVRTGEPIGKGEAVARAVTNQTIQNAVENFLGKEVNKIVGGVTSAITSTKGGTTIVKTIGNSKIGVAMTAFTENIAKNETLSTFFGTLGWDGFIGEMSEEVVQDIADSAITGKDLNVTNLQWWKETGLSIGIMEALGLGGRAGVNVVSTEQRKKVIDQINSHKTDFGIAKEEEITTEGKVINTNTGEVVIDYGEIAKEKDVKKQEQDDLKAMIEKDIAESGVKEEETSTQIEEGQGEEVKTVYTEEGDLSTSNLSKAEEQAVGETLRELQAVVDVGAKEKLVTETEEGGTERNISVEGAIIPEFIPEELRDRKIIQEAMDAIYNKTIPQEGTKAWQVYQSILEEAQGKVEEYQVEKVKEPEVGVWETSAEEVATIPNEPIFYLLDKKGDDWDNAKAVITYDEDSETGESLGYKVVLKNGEVLTDPNSDKVGGSSYFQTIQDAQNYAEDYFTKQETVKEKQTEKPRASKSVKKESLYDQEEEKEGFAKQMAKAEIAEYVLRGDGEDSLRNMGGAYPNDYSWNIKGGKNAKLTITLDSGEEYSYSVKELYKGVLADNNVTEEDLPIQINETEEDKDPLDDPDLPFRINDYGKQVLDNKKLDNATLAELKAESRRIFGNDNVEILSQILTPNRQEALGKYFERWISIRSGKGQGSTFYHEAVHEAIDIFLTPKEKSLLIKEVRTKIGDNVLQKEFDRKTTQEKYDLLTYRNVAMKTYTEGLKIAEQSWTGVQNITNKDGLTQSDVKYLIDLSNSVGVDSNKIFSSVVQETNLDTNEKKIYLVEGIENGIHAINLIDRGMGHQAQLGNLSYGVSAITPSMIKFLKNPYLDIEVFDASKLPYSFDISDASSQREYRIQFGITKDGKGESRFRGVSINASIDAMAEEWLAENIIPYINNQPTTFVGKIKRMVDVFIDRWFKTMDHIDNIEGFYKSLLSGKLLARQQKLEEERIGNFQGLVNSMQGLSTKNGIKFKLEGDNVIGNMSLEEFIESKFNEKPEYGMSHRPTWEDMPRSFDLLETDTLPKDVYEHPEFSLSPNHNDITNQQSWKALLSIRGKPEGEVTIYRAGRKNKLNIGDWVTFSEEYAKDSIEGDEEKVYSFKVKAEDVVFAGDDVNEFGYYPRTELTKIWEKVQKKDNTKYRVEDPESVSLKLPELLSMANELGVNVKLQKSFRKVGKAGEFRPTGENDSRIKLLRSLFTPQGDIVLDEKGKEVQIEETEQQRRERVAQIEHVLAHEIGHLFDWYGGEGNMIQKRGNILGRIANLIHFTETEFRDLSNKEIRKELKTLTQIWSPFDETTVTKSYKSYRYKSEELYAEAISVLLNKPELLKETAPQFYQGFVEYLSRKTEVKTELFAIYDMIKESNEVANRVENMKKAQYEGKGKRMTIDEEQIANKKQKSWQKEITKVKMGFQDQYAPYLDRLRKEWRKGGIELSKVEEAEQLMGDLEYKGNDAVKYAKDVQKEFFTPISEAGIDVETVGEILVLERNLGDRRDLANPQGLIYDYAQETYDYVKSQLTPSQWILLKNKLDWWRNYNYDLVKKGYEAGVYSKKFFEEIATVNKNTYTPFAVVDYIEDNYVTAGIIQATGTTKGVENPLSTQMLKSISLMRLTAQNNAKKGVVRMIKNIGKDEIFEATKLKDTEGKTVGFRHDAKLQRKGYAQLELLEDGKKNAYYVDKYITAMFDSEYGVITWDLAESLINSIEAVNKVFKPAVTVGNPSFQFYSNPIKDYTRSLTGLTALSGMFDDSNVISRTVKVARAYRKEWMKSLKKSWDYAGDNIGETTQKMLDLYVLSAGVKYQDLELGTEKFSFDPVKNKVVYKGGGNLLETMRDKVAKIPVLNKTIVPMFDFYMKVGATLEVNSKIAGFQYLREKVGDEKAALYTRKYIGTPDYMQKGKFTHITNKLFPFSNVGVQAITADSELATRPSTASGYWMSTTIKVILPKLLMFLGSQILKVPIPDPDDPDKEIWVNPYDYLSEYYKGMYMSFPIGYDEDTGKFLFVKVPQDEVANVIGDLIWKMTTYLSGEGMKIEQLGSALISFVPFADGNNPLLSILNDWKQYAQGRNPYDDFRGRLAINQTEWNKGGITRFGEMLKWTTNELGVTNFSTYDKSLNTTYEKTLELPILERMLELTDYGLQEREEWEKAKAKKVKSKDLDGLIEDYYAEPTDEKMLQKIDEYILMEKGEEPEEGWKGDDKTEATRLRQEFKREILQESGNKIYKSISKNGLTNDEKVEMMDIQKELLSEEDYNNYLAQLVRYEIVKGEVMSEYLAQGEVSDEEVYTIVSSAIPVLPASSNNTLVWELRKRDIMSDTVLDWLSADGLITLKGYWKYKPVNSEWYQDKYGDTKTSSNEEDLF